MKENITWSENSDVKQLSFDQFFVSIEIEFDTPFLQAPSLIPLVTPYIGLEAKQHRSEQWQTRFLGSNPFRDVTVCDDERKSLGNLKIEPFASVEYVSSRRALVKVGIIDSWRLLRRGSRISHRLSFSFVAVGPVSNANIAQDGEETNDGLICSPSPSTSPSISTMPSMTPSMYGSTSPSTSPSISTMPSMTPSMYGKGKGGKKESSKPSSPQSATSAAPSAMDRFAVTVGPFVLFGLGLFIIMEG